jgi:uncharacterized protein (TIGR02145 family)
VWSSKNLDVARYRNGDIIPQVTNATQWAALTTGAWCWYNNDSATYAATYGRLYNWYAVNDVRGLAPQGYHIPSDAEWNKLVKYLDAGANTNCINCIQSFKAGGAMKGTTGWNEQNKDALTVSKEFKKEVTPVLTRVLEKRGAGLTDEQYLGYLVGKDLIVKLVIVGQLRSTMNDMINVIKDYTEATKAGNGVTPQPQQQAAAQQQVTPTPTTPQPQYKEPQHSAADFNFQDNEVVVNSTVQQMQVPSTGKARVIAQIEKEKKWQKILENLNVIENFYPKFLKS